MNTQSSRTIPMVRRFASLLALLIGGGLITAVSAQREPAPGAVHALFDLASPSTGPFPSDWFTVQDPGNITRQLIISSRHGFGITRIISSQERIWCLLSVLEVGHEPEWLGNAAGGGTTP